MNKPRYLLAVSLAWALLAAFPAIATDFTLSDSAILSLDYDNGAYYGARLTSRIVTNYDIPGTGVLFTVHFASTNSLDSLFFRQSDSRYGDGTLAGLNVSAYTNFALKFTFVSIDGSVTGTEALVVGAVVGPSRGYPNAFRPESISLSSPTSRSVVSATFVDPGTLTVVGFTVYQTPNDLWSPGPHNITFLVQPANRAVPLEIPKAEHASAPRLP